MENKDKYLSECLKAFWQTKERVLSFREEILYKRKKHLLKFLNLPVEKILEKFSFREMQKDCKSFCVLYENDKTCHEMSPENLNCYGCYCPNYRFEVSFDQEKQLHKLGFCKANSKHGFYKETLTRTEKPVKCLIWNCKDCQIPHKKEFIKKIIEKDLRKLL